MRYTIAVAFSRGVVCELFMQAAERALNLEWRWPLIAQVFLRRVQQSASNSENCRDWKVWHKLVSQVSLSAGEKT